MFEKVINKVKARVYKIQGQEKKFDDLEEHNKWSEKFNTAYAAYDPSIFDTFELIYRGTKETTKNVNSRSSTPVKKTNNVPNIVYELIESEINTTSPEASVKSKKPGFDDQAKMIKEKIMSDLQDFDIDRISDMSERNTYMHGISLVMLNWNTSLGQHEYMGDKELVDYHPKQFIPQPNVYDVKKMDYCFLMGSRSKSSVKEETGVDVEGESEEYPAVNTIGEVGSSNVTNELVTEIVCFYKDKDGDIGKYVWAGSTTIENKPKYFYPRVEECKDCGTENAQGETECKECGSKKLVSKVVMEETIPKETELSPIVYPEKKKVLKENPDGSKYVDEATSQKVIERIVPAGTKIPIPAPKTIPIAVRINIPLNFSFRGRSDVETIRDQQESIKKVWSKAEEKIIQGSGIIGLPKNLRKQPSDEAYQVWQGNAQDLGAIVKHDFTSNIAQDLEFAQANKIAAKDTLGITDSYQGKFDANAKSGKAKQVEVDQAAGRLQSKVRNKFTFYADLFKLMFYFDICFSNEKRPYVTSNAKGDSEYKEFNKYELLCKDDAGEWYYNTDFAFKAELGSNLPHDKGFLYEQTLMMFDKQLITPEQAMEILASLDFPIANKILEQKRAESEEMTQTETILTDLKSMSAEELIQFMQLPLEEQINMIEEMKRGVENNGQPMPNMQTAPLR